MGGIIVLQLLSFLSEVVAASQVLIAFFFRIISHFFQFSRNYKLKVRFHLTALNNLSCMLITVSTAIVICQPALLPVSCVVSVSARGPLVTVLSLVSHQIYSNKQQHC